MSLIQTPGSLVASGSTLGLLADFGFCLDFEDFNQVYASNIWGRGGGRTRANSVCFTKNVVKIGAFPNATPTSKIWKNLSVDQTDQRRRSVWVGHADFSKVAQRKEKFIKHVNCMLTQEN